MLVTKLVTKLVAVRCTAAFLPHRLRRLSAATAIIVTAARTPAALPTTAIAAVASPPPIVTCARLAADIATVVSTSAWQTFSWRKSPRCCLPLLVGLGLRARGAFGVCLRVRCVSPVRLGPLHVVWRL
jgi:hypothetical protein